MAEQTVEVGTERSELNLPDTVTAKVRYGAGDDEIIDEDGSMASPSDAEEEIPVTWDSAPAYDGDTAGSYVFTADVGDYALSGGAKLPRITVTVEADRVEELIGNPPEEPLLKTITGWAYVDDGYLNEGELPLTGVSMEQQVDFDMVVSMLPTQISGSLEGEAGLVAQDITGWSCPDYRQDGDGNWPITGTYTFTAALPEGYACDPLPTVKVLVGGGSLHETDYDGLRITGGAVTLGSDGQIKLQNGSYEISGTWKGTLTDVGYKKYKAVVTVPGGVTANVTLKSVDIDVSRKSGACAFAVEAGGTANITLSGTNVLSSGPYRAGLEVPVNAKVTIGGDGSLTAKSNDLGAGIGGADQCDAGTIVITDNVEVKAMSGGRGAGIGGGSYSDGGTITINGNAKVTAEGGSRGAGIGGGGEYDGSSGDITISGDAEVRAMGTDGGAGIGGGADSEFDKITINENANVTAIGGDHFLGHTHRETSATNGEIRIGDSAVVKAIGRSGSGIGAGGSTSHGVGGSGIGGSGRGTTANNTLVEITGGTVVASSTSGTGIGGGSGSDAWAAWGGSGGVVIISGENTHVTASSTHGADVGNGTYADDGSLSVTDGATLTLANNGTNVKNPQYKGCTIIDKDGKVSRYGISGFLMGSPALSLEVAPEGSVAFQGTVTLTARLSEGVPDDSEKQITFTAGTATYTATTDSTGEAVCQISDLPPGTYRFGASFEDGDNDPASAAEITGYTVGYGTQAALGITGLDSAYTCGCAAFTLSISGGSGSGLVRFISSDPSVASVTGSTVTILKEGTFTITAIKAGDANYTEARVTSHVVTVSQAPPTSSSGGGGSSSSSSVKDRYFDAKKGWVSHQTGIITGSGNGYSRWIQDETGWKLQYADGTTAAGSTGTAEDGKIYEYLTWELISGAWYAFGADGYAKSGMVFDPGLGGYFYIDINSGMKTSWQLIAGNWHYFNPVSDGKQGIMITDTWIDGWYIEHNGIWDRNAKHT